MSEGNISVSNLDQIRALGQPAPNVPIRSDNHDANNTLVLSKRELSVQRNVSVGELRAEDNSVNSRKLRARTLSSPNLGAVVVSSKQERRRESQMEDSAAKFEETKASLYSSGRAKLNKAKKAKRTSQRSADPTRSPSVPPLFLWPRFIPIRLSDYSLFPVGPQQGSRAAAPGDCEGDAQLLGRPFQPR